jgi:hypothetical protein
VKPIQASSGTDHREVNISVTTIEETWSVPVRLIRIRRKRGENMGVGFTSRVMIIRKSYVSLVYESGVLYFPGHFLLH